AGQQNFLRLLRKADRWTEVAQLLERELPTIPSTNTQRQVDVLVELAELRAQRLQRPADAVTAYEAALERDSKLPGAMAALEGLYEHLGRDRELARVL